jgi:hypothetical protein
MRSPSVALASRTAVTRTLAAHRMKHDGAVEVLALLRRFGAHIELGDARELSSVPTARATGRGRTIDPPQRGGVLISTAVEMMQRADVRRRRASARGEGVRDRAMLHASPRPRPAEPQWEVARVSSTRPIWGAVGAEAPVRVHRRSLPRRVVLARSPVEAGGKNRTLQRRPRYDEAKPRRPSPAFPAGSVRSRQPAASEPQVPPCSALGQPPTRTHVEPRHLVTFHRRLLGCVRCPEPRPRGR